MRGLILRYNMKKFGVFFGKCILVALPFILVIGYTFVFPFGYMDNEYPDRAYTKDVIKGTVSYDTIILGDSRVVADIVVSNLGENVVSLANGGATPIENYYYLKNYIKKHGAPKKCFIGFAPFHYMQIDNFWTRTVYFNDLTIPETIELMREAGDIFGMETEGILNDGDAVDLISNRLRLPHVYMPALINSHFIGRYTENKKIYDLVSLERGHHLYGTKDGCSDLNYEVNYEKMAETPDAKLVQEYLLKLMDLCKDNNIETYVISLPMNRSSYENLHESYEISFYMFLRSLSDLYPEAVVENEIICYEDELFGDSSHLNEKGAKKFTEEFKNKYNL